MSAKEYNCPVEATLDVIGGKWKPLILWWLHQHTCRFAELRRLIPGISEKMLTQHLRELKADEILVRRVYAVIPPKVEYSLTEYGRSLEQALQTICEWGKMHMERIGATERFPALKLKAKGKATQNGRRSVCFVPTPYRK